MQIKKGRTWLSYNSGRVKNWFGSVGMGSQGASTCLFFVVFCSLALVQTVAEVQELTEETFAAVTASGHWFVEFYGKWSLVQAGVWPPPPHHLCPSQTLHCICICLIPSSSPGRKKEKEKEKGRKEKKNLICILHLYSAMVWSLPKTCSYVVRACR